MIYHITPKITVELQINVLHSVTSFMSTFKVSCYDLISEASSHLELVHVFFLWAGKCFARTLYMFFAHCHSLSILSHTIDQQDSLKQKPDFLIYKYYFPWDKYTWPIVWLALLLKRTLIQISI